MSKTRPKSKRPASREAAGVRAVHADIDADLYQRLDSHRASCEQTMRVVLQRLLRVGLDAEGAK